MPSVLSPASGVSGTRVPPGPLAAPRQCLPLRLLGWLSLPFFPLVCLFVMDYMNYGGDMDTLRSFWAKHPRSALFEVLVVLFLFLVLTLVLRRTWISALLFGALSLVFAYVIYMKTALNGDHFFPQDLAMASQVGELTSFLSGNVPDLFWQLTAALLLWTLALGLLATALPRSFFWRWSAAAILVLYAHTLTCSPANTEALLNRFGMSTFDSALQSSNYAANGFVGAFTINILSLRVSPPEGYSRQTMEDLLSGYPAVEADPEAEQFDVVVVLSESFFDARILPGVSFSENPLTNYDRLLDDPNCYSGMLYTTALGGGTVRPEFGILTGLTTDYLPDVTTPYWYVTEDLPTYVSNYKDAGYTTLALHPYDAKFYSRNTAYPHLGFDAFYSETDMYGLVSVISKRGYVADQSTAQAIQLLMDQQEEPTFLFTITMENHQPYRALDETDIRIQVDCPALSEESHTALTTYIQGLYDADRMLGMLAEWIDSRERPTVLVFFGDHLPTLGSNFMAYNETGFVDTSDGTSTEEQQKLYSTPFLIYSNRELEGGLFENHTGNQVSDYNLLNSLARSTGMARTPYMELLADFYGTAPFYNVRLDLPQNDAVSPFTRGMRLVTYDRVLGNGWSE